MWENIVYFCVPSRCLYSAHVQNHVHDFHIGCDSFFSSLSILQTAVKWDLKKREVGKTGMNDVRTGNLEVLRGMSNMFY